MDGQNFENNQDVDNKQDSSDNTYYQDNTAAYQQTSHQSQMSYQTEQPAQTNTLAIISLVLGIISIVAGCCFAWVGCLFGIGGIICAVFAKKQGTSGMATAGLVCSIIGIIMGIAVTIVAVVFMGALSSELLNYGTYTHPFN